MGNPKHLAAWIGLALLVVLGVTGALTREHWQDWLNPRTESSSKPGIPPPDPDHVKISEPARKNLGLIVGPVPARKVFWRTIEIPGSVVERHGISDRGVTAPIAGVITDVAAFPGDTVRSGDPLFTLRLVGDSLQNNQAELYKKVNEMEIKDHEIKRLEAAGEAVAGEKLIDMRHQKRLLGVARLALRFDLKARGLSQSLIDGIEKGKFVTEITIRVPAKPASSPKLSAVTNGPERSFEVEKLHVQLGEQVHAGQILCILADHQSLFVEGRVFKQEVPLLERAAKERWPVEIELPDEEPNSWSASAEPLKILFLGNRFDPASQTVPVYVPLPNQYHEYKDREGGKVYRVWRYRPDHSVFLRVPVEKFDNVIVLPAAAIVPQGAEIYVFVESADGFHRKPIHVLYQDRHHAVLGANPGISPGDRIAFNQAAHLNRLLLTQLNPVGGQEEDHD